MQRITTAKKDLSPHLFTKHERKDINISIYVPRTKL